MRERGTGDRGQGDLIPPLPLGEGWGEGVAATLRTAVRDRTLVVKLGGSVGHEDTLPDDVTLLQEMGAHVVLVHGGGPLITDWLERVGKETHFVRGLRYTDAETLDVVRMVLTGLVNGDIVARIGAAGGRAVGLSGSDAGLLCATVRDPGLGLVGEVTVVNPHPVRVLLDAGYIVVVAPVAIVGDGTFLNVNADTAAAEVAVALAADRLVFLTDVDGISDGTGTHRRLTPEEARQLVASGVISGGMIPKVDACVRALATTREAHIIDGTRPHGLLQALAEPGVTGTTLGAGAPSRR